MIDINKLKQLVLEVFAANPYTPVADIVFDVERLAEYHNVFPSRHDCCWQDIYTDYYQKKQLSPVDKAHVNQIIWQLIRDDLLSIDNHRLN